MSYVGRDCVITIQVPVDREEKTIPGTSPYEVTLSNGPISDRDQDGVADEVAHVSVVDGSGATVTPTAVNDAQKKVTFGVGDAGKTVYVTYRYDKAPYVAQEISIEPKQEVEGLDGLGSETVQLWAFLLKEYGGSIKEVFKNTLEQLNRVEALRTATVEKHGVKVDWAWVGYHLTLWLDNVIFEESSVSASKSGVSFIVTPFKAMTAKIVYWI